MSTSLAKSQKSVRTRSKRDQSKSRRAASVKSVRNGQKSLTKSTKTKSKSKSKAKKRPKPISKKNKKKGNGGLFGCCAKKKKKVPASKKTIKAGKKSTAKSRKSRGGSSVKKRDQILLVPPQPETKKQTTSIKSQRKSSKSVKSQRKNSNSSKVKLIKKMKQKGSKETIDSSNKTSPQNAAIPKTNKIELIKAPDNQAIITSPQLIEDQEGNQQAQAGTLAVQRSDAPVAPVLAVAETDDRDPKYAANNVEKRVEDVKQEEINSDEDGRSSKLYPTYKFVMTQFVENNNRIRRWSYEDSVPLNLESNMKRVLGLAKDKVTACRTEKDYRAALNADLDQLSCLLGQK